jgi:hypothetical protein
MARLKNVRERIHQPFFDHLLRGIGTSALSNNQRLFTQNAGNPQFTNMAQAGALPSDATYVIKSIRCSMFFQGLNDGAWNTAYGTLPVYTGAIAANVRAQDCFQVLAHGAYFTLTVGTKDMLVAPLWYAPAGGGIFGATTENSRQSLQNGLPSQEAILKLAKDIHVPARQNFTITANFYPFAPFTGAGLNANGATLGGVALDPLATVNQFDGIKSVSFFIDGVQTRDVQ